MSAALFPAVPVDATAQGSAAAASAPEETMGTQPIGASFTTMLAVNSSSRVQLESLATRAAEVNGVPVPLFLALVNEESGWNPSAVSSAGAMGLTQLMPGTAAGLGVANPFDVTENLNGGARYLAEQLQTFGSVPLALAAYNAGPGAVREWGGVPPYPQVQSYVRNIMSAAGYSS